jgi:hypothetical protein
MRLVTDLENGPYDPIISTLVTASLFAVFSLLWDAFCDLVYSLRWKVNYPCTHDRHDQSFLAA